MKIELHLFTYNEEKILAYTLRHYETFCTSIVVHDAGSTDRTRAIALNGSKRRKRVKVVDLDTGGNFNDRLQIDVKNACWKGTKADWVIIADADELVYFPEGWKQTLEAYLKQGLAVVKPQGWDMFSPVFPHTSKQIYSEIRQGASNDAFYGKPCLFQPALVAETGFEVGMHDSRTVLEDGTCLPPKAAREFSNPPTYLLHYKWIGPLEALGNRLLRRWHRLSDENKQAGWGDYRAGETPFEKARREREDVMNRLEVVIPPSHVVNSYSVVILSAKIENVVGCVAAIRKCSGHQRNWIFVVADGISKEDRAKVLECDVIWVEGHQPFGYSANANLGIDRAGPDDVVLCNDDAWVEENCGGFDALNAASSTYDLISAVVRGRCSCPRQSDLSPGTREEPTFFAFMCVHIPRRTLDVIGPLDEQFDPGCSEDNDYCARVKFAGMKMAVCGDCIVNHPAERTTFAKRPDYQQVFDASRRLLYRKWGIDGLAPDGAFIGPARTERLFALPARRPVDTLTVGYDKFGPIVLPQPIKSVPADAVHIKPLRSVLLPESALLTDFARTHGKTFREWLGHLAGQPGVRGMVAGELEWQSSEWLLQNICVGSSILYCVGPAESSYPLSEICRFHNKVIISRRADEALETMPADDRYDFIYLNEALSESMAIRDLVLAFYRTKIGGVVIWDRIDPAAARFSLFRNRIENRIEQLASGVCHGFKRIAE